MKRYLVLGGPGAGKTTRLLQLMEQAMQGGMAPQEIAFVAFTNAAADEAKARAMERFGLGEDDLLHFRTLHSLCFRQLGLRRNDLLTHGHMKEFAEVVGERFAWDSDVGPAIGKGAIGDHLLNLDNYARTTLTKLEDAWHEHGAELDWYRVLRFTKAYRLYKTDLALLDFTDFLEQYVINGEPVNVRMAIVDEAQDLTPLQWAVVDRAFGGAESIWAAGDDDQSIHRWAGAAPEYLQRWGAKARVEVLEHSHRLPPEIFNLSQEIINRVGVRYPKRQRSGTHKGLLDWLGSPDEVDLRAGTWLLLGRSTYQLANLAQTARSQGVIYQIKGESSVNAEHVRAIQAYEALRAGKRIDYGDAKRVMKALGRPDPEERDEFIGRDFNLNPNSPIWHDALIRVPLDDREYYLACLRRGEKLTASPRVRINTIHGAKGTEAENVMLLTDMTYRVQKGYELDPDSEHRVFYVGATRAQKSLYLVNPQTSYEYRF